MLQLILIIAGIYILVRGEINFSKERVLVKPNSVYVGIALIVNGVILGLVNPFVVWGLFMQSS